MHPLPRHMDPAPRLAKKSYGWRVLVLISLLTPVACVTRPLPGRDWENPIDLNYSYDSFHNVNLEVRCETRNASGAIAIKAQPICKTIAQYLSSHGAITPEDRARAARAAVTGDTKLEDAPGPLTNLTLELIRGPTQTESCGLFSISLALSLGILPCSSIRSTPTEVRILDPQGVAVESHVIIDRERRIYGSSALLLLINRRARQEMREHDYRFIRYIENRVYTADLRVTALNGARDANSDQDISLAPRGGETGTVKQ